MFKILEGGHFKKKGYLYILFFTLPKFFRSKTKNILGQDYIVTKVSLSTKFELTSSPNYVNLLIRVLGFGLGLQIHVKSDNYQGEISE